MKITKFIKIKKLLALTLTCAMVMAISLPAGAQQVSTKGKVKANTTAVHTQSSAANKNLVDVVRNSVYIREVNAYPTDGSIYYTDIKLGGSYYDVNNSFISPTLTQAAKTSLEAQFKSASGKDPTGWYMSISYEVVSEQPISLDITIDGQKQDTLDARDGYTYTTTYLTPKMGTSLGGYLSFHYMNNHVVTGDGTSAFGTGVIYSGE